jgi:hypothetical protein
VFVEVGIQWNIDGPGQVELPVVLFVQHLDHRRAVLGEALIQLIAVNGSHGLLR